MTKIFTFVFLFLIFPAAIGNAQSPTYSRYTDDLTPLLESNATIVLNLKVMHEVSSTLCFRLGGPVAEETKKEVALWNARNGRYTKAAADAINEFANRYIPNGGEQGKQSYYQMVVREFAKVFTPIIMDNFDGASIDNQIVPSKMACERLVTYLREGKGDFQNDPGNTKALIQYMKLKDNTAIREDHYKTSKDNPAASQPSPDVFDKVITDLLTRNGGSILCLPNGISRDSVRAVLSGYLKDVDTNNPANAKAISVAFYTAFPCPFSPYRPELRFAKRDDLTGYWLFPELSQKLRYGPKSSNWKSKPGMPPIKCEGVYFGANGDALIAQIGGKSSSCLTSTDMKKFEKYPKVEFWAFLRDGRIRINRSDISDHIEEWDYFVVEQPFDFAQVHFMTGDLIGYCRRLKDTNDFNVATMFRHLQRLP